MKPKKEDEILLNLGKRIVELRKQKGLKQYDFPIDERTMRRIENETDIYNPSLLVLVKICDTLKISLSELFIDL